MRPAQLVRAGLRRLGAALCGLSVAAAAAWAEAPSIEDLIAAYPDFLSHKEDDTLVWRDGTRMPIHDGNPDKTFEEALDAGSLADQLSQDYPDGRLAPPPGRDEDPGRIRHQPFFLKMYGDCRTGEVEGRLREVVWMPRSAPQRLAVTTVNGVADRLEAVIAELERLPDGLRRYLTPSAGTFACRPIAGTDRLSMHAYGAAIDIAVAEADYWLWAPQGAPLTYRNRIPYEIVEIFERHGFIWGGKWHHFDTMHFEYRPEYFQSPD